MEAKDAIFNMKKFADKVMEALREAEKLNIEANAIAINDRLIYSRLLHNFSDVPMICGLKVVYSNSLPDNVEFAVFKGTNLPQTKDEQIDRLAKENAELKEKLHQIALFIDEGLS